MAHHRYNTRELGIPNKLGDWVYPGSPGKAKGKRRTLTWWIRSKTGQGAGALNCTVESVLISVFLRPCGTMHLSIYYWEQAFFRSFLSSVGLGVPAPVGPECDGV